MNIVNNIVILAKLLQFIEAVIKTKNFKNTAEVHRSEAKSQMIKTQLTDKLSKTVEQK